MKVILFLVSNNSFKKLNWSKIQGNKVSGTVWEKAGNFVFYSNNPDICLR